MLQGHTARWGGRPALSFVSYSHHPDGSWHTLTFSEVDRRSRALAAALELRFPRGSRVGVLCPQGNEYALALLACLYAGMIAVPLFPPVDPRRIRQLEGVLSDADPVCLLTVGPEVAACQELTRGRALVWAVEETDPRLAPQWSGKWAEPSEVAYLQYTSGSTGRPAGAVITHANLVASTLQCLEGYGVCDRTPVVSWLPLFHDLGLSNGVLTPMLAGAHVALMSPLAFIQRPARWLRLLHTHRGHLSAGPNFTYELCVRKITDPAKLNLDLSSVGVLVNGAEPVRTETLRRFTEAFAASGLAPDVIKPSYGLAEATVLVSCNRPAQRWTELTLDRDALTTGRIHILDPSGAGAASRGATTVVGCGRPVGQDVKVADPDSGVEREPGLTGEIWVRGPNVAAGYWNQPQRSAELFDRTLKTADGASQGWLRTGDLGFVHEDEVYILARMKNVIVIHGSNHTADDIEDTVQQAIGEAVPGGVAAFAVPGSDDDGEGERLVVIVELTAGPDAAETIALRRRVQQAVAERHGVRPHDVLAARRGTLPRTTSGKLRRGDCRDRYLTEHTAAATAADKRQAQ
ncbi:fatty acyl-AMP ligase [Streptomyces sp. NPDC055796]